MFKKNAELILTKHEESVSEYDIIHIAKDVSKKYIAPDSETYDARKQAAFLAPLQKLISEDGTSKYVEFEVLPALRKKPNNTRSKMYLNPYDLTDWLPNAFMTYSNL